MKDRTNDSHCKKRIIENNYCRSDECLHGRTEILRRGVDGVGDAPHIDDSLCVMLEDDVSQAYGISGSDKLTICR